MADLNWRRFHQEFEAFAEEIRSGTFSDTSGIGERLRRICATDPACDESRLGVESFLIAFLEFLFFKAEGPYSPNFLSYTDIIKFLFSSSDPLKTLIDHNAADAISNMVLNKRGKLKFLIADHVELAIILERWPWFGLKPVTERQVFDAAIRKPLLRQRLDTGDPGLLLRLLEVFPDFRSEICKKDQTWEELISRQAEITPLPSWRRYYRLYSDMVNQGRDLHEIIREEEQRILPVQVRRNTFLAFLVKKLHQDTCQICPFCERGEIDPVITVHHIVPLSRGGVDKAINMLVVCQTHHQAIHDGLIKVSISDKVRIQCQNGSYLIDPDFF